MASGTTLARHPLRPYTPLIILIVFTDFQELAGDQRYADDKAIVGGIARLDGRPVMIIGHQKDVKRKKKKFVVILVCRLPEGYRKSAAFNGNAQRNNVLNYLLSLFIDTPGAYPGVGAEERGQSKRLLVI